MTRFDSFREALGQLDGSVLALDPRSVPQLTAIVADLAAGRDVTSNRLASLGRTKVEAASPISFVPVVGGGGKALAIVTVKGVALYDFEFQPHCFSTRKLAAIVDELADDPIVGRIVLDINTPGGQVTGTQEAADAVYKAARKKNIVGIINPLCASAGYWIGSQCTKLIAVPSADVGSIGVFMMHVDYSSALANAGIKPTFIYAGEHKTEGNSVEPLGEGAKAWFQTEVNQTYSDFLAAVARGRRTTADIVKASFGGGRCFGAPMAKSVGMIDEIATPDRAFRSAAFISQAVAAPITTSAAVRQRRISILEAS